MVTLACLLLDEQTLTHPVIHLKICNGCLGYWHVANRQNIASWAQGINQEQFEGDRDLLERAQRKDAEGAGALPLEESLRALGLFAVERRRLKGDSINI